MTDLYLAPVAQRRILAYTQGPFSRDFFCRLIQSGQLSCHVDILWWIRQLLHDIARPKYDIFRWPPTSPHNTSSIKFSLLLLYHSPIGTSFLFQAINLSNMQSNQVLSNVRLPDGIEIPSVRSARVSLQVWLAGCFGVVAHL